MSRLYDSEGKKRANEKDIRIFWNKNPLGKYLNHKHDVCEEGKYRPCMACGGYGNDRAHILALSEGGSNLASNLHMLCRECHIESEALSGYNYWLWIICKSTLFEYGTDLDTELDEDKKGVLKRYPNSGLHEKLEKYSTLYEQIALLKGFKIPKEWGKAYLMAPENYTKLKFNNEDIKEIEKIMERN